MYGRYCTKYAYSYIHINYRSKDGSIDWPAVCSGTVEAVFRRAYNERRRNDLEERFGYFNPNMMEVP